MRQVRATVIHNPLAGGARRRRVGMEAALSRLRHAGWEIEVLATQGRGSATDLARRAVSRGADVVVAAGGDGTINEVIQALAGSSVSLGCLPLGTVNVWAREVGLPNAPLPAAEAMAAGVTVRVDLGRVDGRYFLLMASVGLDAEVAAAVGDRQRSKQRLGVLPYVVRTVATVPRFRGGEYTVLIDEEERRAQALMLLISNTRLYGGIGRLTPDAIADDGLLDVRWFEGRGPIGTLRHLGPLLVRGRTSASDGVLRARSITVEAEPRLAVQVDGEFFGYTPIGVEIEKQALRALVPADYDRTLIREETPVNQMLTEEST